MGNDLETSEVLYFVLFCIILKNAYLDYKGNIIFYIILL